MLALNANSASVSPGDLVFFLQDSTDKSHDKAILLADKNHGNVLHVAILYKVYPTLSIIHATQKKGIVMEKLNTAFNNIFENDKGRLQFYRVNANDKVIESALNYAKSHLRRPYNDVFAENNINSSGQHSFYCSQLVEQAFNQASDVPIFKKQPLNFRDHEGKIIKYWKEYYKTLRLPIPENQLGTHPGSIYKSENITAIDYHFTIKR